MYTYTAGLRLIPAKPRIISLVPKSLKIILLNANRRVIDYVYTGYIITCAVCIKKSKVSQEYIISFSFLKFDPIFHAIQFLCKTKYKWTFHYKLIVIIILEIKRSMDASIVTLFL
jgi:hypothetical protein